MKFEGFPFNVGWELTLACNLRCSHCASVAGQKRPEELTTDEALSICRQFPELLVQEVDLTGGEPLLRDDWVEVASCLRDLGISVNILSNGIAINESVVAQMRSVGITSVGVSLDGLEQTHNHIRGRRDSFYHVLKAIDLMQDAGIGVIVITTVTNLNINQLAELQAVLARHYVANWRLQPVVPIGRVIDFSELELDDSSILQLGNYIKKSFQDAKNAGMQIICSDGLEYIEGTEDPKKPWKGCPGGWVTCGITADGKVKTCLSLPDEVIEGDLRERSLWDIWFDPNCFISTRNFDMSQLGKNCNNCDKAQMCKGGCSSNSYAATGVYHNDPYCYYALNRDILAGNELRSGLCRTGCGSVHIR